MDMRASSLEQNSRRSAILTAANQLFAQAGYTAASMRDIAQRAGVSTTLLSHHFGTKAGLLVAVLDGHGMRFAARAQSIRTASKSSSNDLSLRRTLEKWLAREVAAAVTEDGSLFRLLVWRVSQDPDPAAEKLARDCAAEVRNAFEGAISECNFAAPPQLAAALWGFIEGAIAGHLVSRLRMPSTSSAEATHQPTDQALLAAFIVGGAEAAARLLVPEAEHTIG